MPVVILFSVGPAAAVICTMIYAVPPAVRITALGIRGVTADTVEASKAFGATSLQTLFKVQLPLARRQMLLSVNQTIMFALSLVVIAGLIGGRGLGDVVTSGLYSNASLAMLAGAAIVIMAIALDRATAAIAERTDPTRRHLTDEGRRRAKLVTLGTLVAIAAIVLVARALGAAESYPDEFETATTVYTATIQDTLLDAIQSVLDYVQDPTSFIFGITEPIGNFLVEYALEPLRALLVETAVVRHGAGPVRDRVRRQRPAAGAHGAGDAARDRDHGRLGPRDGHRLAGARRDRARGRVRNRARRLGGGEPARRAQLRPILDMLQTLPQLVYIIPFIYLMPVSRVPGVVASVLYAVPVVIRLVDAGVRDVAPAAVEAASAFGATRRQVLAKVKMPLARDAIMLGVNQGIIMVLAVVVIGGLVGSGALGDLVARGLQRNEFGRGRGRLAARSSALGIALDRVTQSEGRREEVNNDEGTSHEESEEGARNRRARAGARAGRRRVRRGEGGEPAASGDSGAAAAKDCGKVTINENAWAGSTANVYIAKAVLEDKLGCEVEITKIAGDPRLPGDGRRQGRRGARGLAARRRVREVHREGRAPSSTAGRSASRGTSAGSSRST